MSFSHLSLSHLAFIASSISLTIVAHNATKVPKYKLYSQTQCQQNYIIKQLISKNGVMFLHLRFYISNFPVRLIAGNHYVN